MKNGHIRQNKHMSDVVKKASVGYLSILHGNIADIIRRYQIPIASDEIVTLLLILIQKIQAPYHGSNLSRSEVNSDLSR